MYLVNYYNPDIQTISVAEQVYCRIANLEHTSMIPLVNYNHDDHWYLTTNCVTKLMEVTE